MSREQMILAIVADMPAWLKREASSFWDHFQELEIEYLKKQSDENLRDIYDGSMD